MKVIFGMLIILVAVVTVSDARAEVGLNLGSRCMAVGQFLVHGGSRCHYIQCSYRAGSGIVGIARQCPSGTIVPWSTYTYSYDHQFYHQRAVCSQRSFGRLQHGSDCHVPTRTYAWGNKYKYQPRYQPRTVIFHRPRKSFRRFPVVSRVYKANAISIAPAPKTRPLPEATMMPVLLNDMPEYNQQPPAALNPSSETSKMAAPMQDHVYENEIHALLSPPGEKEVDYAGYDYKMDSAEEEEVMRSVRELLPVEKPDILSDEDSKRVRQEIMESIFKDLN